MAKANVVTGQKPVPTGIKVEKPVAKTNETVHRQAVAAKAKTIAKPPTPAELAAAAPAPKAAVKKEKKMGAKDVFGFGENSQTSFLIRGIESGKYTRAELLAAFIKQFCSDGKDEGGDKRKKISFSVFFSDIKKPFAAYHASRGLIINEDPKTKKLSLDVKRADAVTLAIKKGILNQLKGHNKERHPKKINEILKSHGLPLLEIKG